MHPYFLFLKTLIRDGGKKRSSTYSQLGSALHGVQFNLLAKEVEIRVFKWKMVIGKILVTKLLKGLIRNKQELLQLRGHGLGTYSPTISQIESPR